MDDERSATDLDEDADDDDELQVAPALRDAAERLLAHSRAGGPASRWSSDQERVIGLLQLLGRLNEQRQHAAGLFTEDDEPVDEEERRYQAERDRGFIVHCADSLVEIAAAALEFAIELTASFDGDKPARQARNDAIDELRSELLGELVTLPPRPGVPGLSPTKRDVSSYLGMIVLRSAALDVAVVAYELTYDRFPGQAAMTAVYLAAQLLIAGEEIATAVDYRQWPALDDI